MTTLPIGLGITWRQPTARAMLHAFLAACLLIASQPLLVGIGVLAKWAITCGGGACAATAHAASPFGASRDTILTALALAAPYLLAVLVAAVTWLLASQQVAEPAAEPFPAWRESTLSPASRPEELASAGDVRGRLPVFPFGRMPPFIYHQEVSNDRRAL